MRTALNFATSSHAKVLVELNDHSDLTARYSAIRAGTEALVAPLSAEDCALQSMPDCSPAKWHLAHTSWFFETFVLEATIADYRPYNAAFRVLFNSYYQSVGEQYERPHRSLLTRPSLEEVKRYRHHIDQQMMALLKHPEQLPHNMRGIIELGLNHEQQHQELLLTDIKHLFSFNPLHPAYRQARVSARHIEVSPMGWIAFGAGLTEIGHDGNGFAFDNEGPRHTVYLHPYRLATRLVTNAEYVEFISAGGYARPEFWLSDGWNKICTAGWQHPLYWQQQDGAWVSHTLNGLQPIALNEPVCHVSYYEADAYARYADARLATEMEWEHGAASVARVGNFVESGQLHPAADSNNESTLSQLFGDLWEWTASPYAPYPGFKAPAGALGEYNGKFMCNQMVLRGGSCVTPRSHIRASYRNFFPPDARWQFSGIRLARDV